MTKKQVIKLDPASVTFQADEAGNIAIELNEDTTILVPLQFRTTESILDDMTNPSFQELATETAEHNERLEELRKLEADALQQLQAAEKRQTMLVQNLSGRSLDDINKAMTESDLAKRAHTAIKKELDKLENDGWSQYSKAEILKSYGTAANEYFTETSNSIGAVVKLFTDILETVRTEARRSNGPLTESQLIIDREIHTVRRYNWSEIRRREMNFGPAIPLLGWKDRQEPETVDPLAQ